MKTFKNFLSESNATMNVTKMGLDDLLIAYKNAGYEVSKNERKFFYDSHYEGYKGTSGHSFVVMMEDDNSDDGGFYLTRFFVTLGKEGTLVAEPSGTPFLEGDEETVMRKFLLFSR